VRPVTVRRERVVSIPVDVLWQLVEPVQTLSAWLPLADRCESRGGEGLGRKQRMYSTWGGKTAELDQEVIAYQPNGLLRWKHVDERMNGKPAPRVSREVTFSIELESIGPGTRVALESKNVPSGVFTGILLRLVAAPRIRKALDRALENLAGASR
jgi:hypothetical protein